MNDEELRDYLKRFCFGREHLICSRDLVRQKNLRESDLRKKVNRLRRKAVPIASSREGYFYHSQNYILCIYQLFSDRIFFHLL